MKTFVNSVSGWDHIFAAAIFGLNGRKVLAIAMPWVSHTGNGYYYPVVPAALLLIDAHKAWIFFLASLFAFGIELPLYKLIKNGIKRDRPCEALSNIHGRVSPSDQFSFPSGHTAAAFVMATLISYFFPLLSMPVISWALLVGFSRIYLGVHYPTDILAGMAVGLLSALAALSIVV
ncbi:putative membrane-associated phospholipid phosphatase, PAP2 superfamily [Olavius algarvensis Delta 1 endosymbiont]|nr:putative membrane-associated phospholipid phosphatase, PAP2 superfamily [Olavius algarvensis Delta 1 endosymbiont]